MNEMPRARLFFEGQLIHFAALAVLLSAVYGLRHVPGFEQGSFLDIPTSSWAIFAIANAVIHQVFVWLCWRAELHGHLLTKWFGRKAFGLYAALFTILFVLRPLLLFALGWANRGSLNINMWFGYAVSALMFFCVIYLMYSIIHYFSFSRAFGIDHFDPQYRNAPLIRQGIFRWSPNAMYVFGFAAIWIPAFLFQSVTALIVAAFSHAYIWVHYYATEKPDMTRIYG